MLGGLGRPELFGFAAAAGNILIEFGLDRFDEVGDVGLVVMGTGSLPGMAEELLAPEFFRIDFLTGSEDVDSCGTLLPFIDLR